MKAIVAAIVFGFLPTIVRSAIEADLVTELPGWEGGALPSKHYSGYISVGTITDSPGQLHYWFIESENDPASDPVVLWLNGGPGSSSLIGLLTENGQIYTSDSSIANQTADGIPQVFYNSYGWTTKANMLYLESPKGVGFSYCEGVRTAAACVNTDESTAQDAYEFLVNFFEAFPEYKANDFYITGESYAGIYIPMLMDEIDQDSLSASLNLKGAAIGNGCWGNDVGTCAFYTTAYFQINTDFLYGHGMISQTLYKQVQAACGTWDSLSVKCLKTMEDVSVEAGAYNVYNIYDECGVDQLTLRSSLMSKVQKLALKEFTVETKDTFALHPALGQALNDYECGAENAMDVWLDEPSVQEALHVKGDTIGMTYKKTASDLRGLYAELIQKYRILIYSGDTDGCVPYVGSEAWTRGLNFTVTDDWHSWYSKPDEVHSQHKAGYAISYDANGFQFITINGAGHMVPQYQPAYSLTMFEKFLTDSQF